MKEKLTAYCKILKKQIELIECIQCFDDEYPFGCKEAQKMRWKKEESE